MKKISLVKILTMTTLLFVTFPSDSNADNETLPTQSLFQSVVLLNDQSQELDVAVERYSAREGNVKVLSPVTGKPISDVKIFSMTRYDEVYLLGKTDPKGTLNFEDGYKHVIQLNPRGGYRSAEKFHSTKDIDLVIAMVGKKLSVGLFKKEQQLKPTY